MTEEPTLQRVRRVERINRTLATLLVVTWIGGALLGVSNYRRLEALSTRPADRVVSGPTEVDGYGVRINVPFRTHPTEQVGAEIKVTDLGAFMAVGIGHVGIDESVGDLGPIVTWSAEGTVTSNVEVNTDTGEWVLHRVRSDGSAKIIKEERRQLIAPLEP